MWEDEVTEAKKVVKDCYEILDNHNTHPYLVWTAVRDIAKEYLDELPEEVLEVFDLYRRAMENLGNIYYE